MGSVALVDGVDGADDDEAEEDDPKKDVDGRVEDTVEIQGHNGWRIMLCSTAFALSFQLVISVIHTIGKMMKTGV